jgi:hypothetical protein
MLMLNPRSRLRPTVQAARVAAAVVTLCAAAFSGPALAQPAVDAQKP